MVNNHSLEFLDDQLVPQLCPQATWTAAAPRKDGFTSYMAQIINRL